MTNCREILEHILDKTHAVRDEVNYRVMKEADYNDITTLIFEFNTVRSTIGNMIWTETLIGIRTFTDDSI